MKKLIDFFARQALFSELMTFLVLAYGVYSLLTIKREVFPNVQYDVVLVNTIYPGAAPSEVEKLVTNPLERELKEVDGIKKILSYSTESRSGIVMMLDPNQTNQEEAKADIQDVVDRVKDLPKEVEDPEVMALESKVFPVVEVNVTGGVDEFQRKEAARYLEREIEKMREVASVKNKGEREFEVQVEASSKKLRQYQITIPEIVEALAKQNVAIPGGAFKVNGENGLEKDIIVRTEGQFADEFDVEEAILRSNDYGKAVRLKDVAKVRMSLKKASVIERTDGKDSIRLIVMKKEDADAIELIDNLKAMTNELDSPLLDDIEIQFVNDLSILIRRRLGVLSNNLLVGLVLVVLVLSLFLPFRVSLVTAIGIPFSFLGCIAYFHGNDISLNLITMMGLIIVIGMLVDDAVVVTENAVRRMENGEKPMDAAIAGTQEIWLPVFASVMTTVLAFYPMLTMTGIFGKFVSFIPLGVICALLISLVECYFVLPYHIGAWISPRQLQRPPGGFRDRFDRGWKWIINTYGGFIYKVTRFRYLALISFLAFVAFSIFVAATQMKNVLFPARGIDQFNVKFKAPVGTSLEQTKKLALPVEELIAKLPKNEVRNYVTTIGQQQARPDEAPVRGSHYGQIMVYLMPEGDRDRLADDIIGVLRDQYSELHPEKEGEPPFTVSFEKANAGPPVGKPISIGVRGSSYEEIMPLVEEIEEQLQEMDGVKDLSNDYSVGKDQWIVKVDTAKALNLGLNPEAIGLSVMAGLEGVVNTSIKGLEDEIDIRVSLPESEKRGSEGLANLKVANRFGRMIPLKRVAKFEKEKGVETFFHMGNQRQVTISGDVDAKKITAVQVAKHIADQEKAFKSEYPNLSLDFGGEEQDTRESMESLGRAFLMALVLIYFLLILTFQSFVWPVIIIMAIPLGVVSVIWALFIHGEPLSFMGMLGVVALAGVIVNNAIVMVDFVRAERRNGKRKRESIINACKNRLRPIFLTTFTTVCGILPTAYGVGGLDYFIVPIAISLGWGMFFGSILSSLFLPAFIAILDDVHRLFSRRKQSPAEAQ